LFENSVSKNKHRHHMINNCLLPEPENVYHLRRHGRTIRSWVYDQRKIFNPSWFQGNRETRRYFEGWYFKNVSADEKSCWSFIPGISLTQGDDHAFVQVINGLTGQTLYYRYPAGDFSFLSTGFKICLGGNFFSEKMIVLDLDNGQDQFKGEIIFEDSTRYPARISRPGIMGWYRYVPFMECYHGVVSLDHSLKGSITHNLTAYDFFGGRGYIEKDWGSSMPKSWIWMQTNHFEESGTSFMVSVARIPWIGKTFTGFLGFFLHKGKIISFATYTGAIITTLEHDRGEVWLNIIGKKYLIEIHALQPPRSDGKPREGLKAPVFGNMERVIHESIDSTIEVTVTAITGEKIFSGTGRSAGFEMVGDLDLLKL
jgi:tocopherol cyclase